MTLLHFSFGSVFLSVATCKDGVLKFNVALNCLFTFSLQSEYKEITVINEHQ